METNKRVHSKFASSFSFPLPKLNKLEEAVQRQMGSIRQKTSANQLWLPHVSMAFKQVLMQAKVNFEKPSVPTEACQEKF